MKHTVESMDRRFALVRERAKTAAAGSVLHWAIHREGTVLRWVRSDLETVLAPDRRGNTPARRRR